jgi:hypothetical protein
VGRSVRLDSNGDQPDTIRSTDRVRTTHVGSLALPKALLDLMKAGAERHPVDPGELAKAERRAVADVVARQRGGASLGARPCPQAAQW